jgi:hypothetical protein
MTDLARLGIVITSEQAEIAEDRLDGMARAADRAENATDSLATAARRAGSATEMMNSGIRQQEAVLTATRGSLGLTATEGLNLSRQFTDIGVTAAMGMNPLMIAIQQGPQILDTFQMAAQRTGTSVKAVMLQAGIAIWTAMAPLLPFIAAAAAAAVIGGGLALATRALNKENSDLAAGLGLTEEQLEKVKDKGVTMGDVLVGTFDYVKDIIWDNLGPAITKIGDWFSDVMDKATRFSVQAIKVIVGTFLGGFRAIRAVWGTLPAVMGDLAVSAVNGVVRALEWMVNKAVQGINLMIGAAKQLSLINPAFAAARGLSFLSPVDLAEMANANAGAARAAGETIAREFAGGMADASGIVDRQIAAIAESIEDAARRRIRREAGDADRARSGAAGGRDAAEREVMFPTQNIGLRPLNAVVEMLDPLQVVADELRLIDTLAQDAARGMASAFGDAGRAMGDLLTTMTGYQSRLAEIALAEKEYKISGAQADRERASAQVQSYGDMLGAAKGFFKEGSDGYQALQAAEQAYRIYQFAMSVQAMMMGGQETAFTVGQTIIRAASHGVVAVARALASLPFPFNLAAGAATLAALVAIGVKLTGGGGGGGSSGSYNPAPINSRDSSIATARSQASASQGAAANGTQRVDVRVTTEDRRFNAYVDQRAQPYADAVGSTAVQASRASVPADRARAEAFKMGGRGR